MEGLNKKSILLNKNHIYNNLGSYSNKGSAKTSRVHLDRNQEFMNLKKCIEQIPDNDMTDLNMHKAQVQAKYNHTYISNVGVPDCESDIEEVSLLATERTSELTTEHCSDAKHCQSHQNHSRSDSNKVVYKFNLPTK